MNFTTLLNFYSDSHMHPLNKILHYLGVPFVLFATLQFFSWIHISMPGLFDIHTSWILYLALVIYYFRLDSQCALLFAALLIPFTLLANFLSGYWPSFFIFSILFAGGWVLQILGHIIEGRQPAFVDRPAVIPLLPLLTLADAMRERGYRTDLQRETTQEVISQ